MSINWDLIKKSENKQDRLANARAELGKQEYICLSDILIRFDQGASQVLEALDIMSLERDRARNPYTYKLQVLRGKWGEEYKPGDVIEWKRKVYTREHGDQGRKLTSQEIEAKIRRGEGHKKFGLAEVAQATIDEYGCIEVDYRDAVTLLSNNGQHFATGYGITDKREVSGRPYYTEGNPDPWDTRKTLVKGQTRHCWGWLYKEVPPGTQLEKINKSKPGPRPKQDKETDHESNTN